MNTILAFLTFATLAHADPQTVPSSALRIIDGDTVALGSERIRFLEIDAPETEHAHCPSELAAGNRATEELRHILAGRSVTIERHGLDRYRRTLARIVIDGRSAGAILLDRHLVLTWRPGRAAHRERTAHWCGPGDW